MCHNQALNLGFLDKLGRSVIPISDTVHVSVALFVEVKGKGSVAVILVSKESLRFHFC